MLYKDCSVEDLRDELPDCQPRFIVYSYCYQHDDGRKSYPLCFIFVSPQGLPLFVYLTLYYLLAKDLTSNNLRLLLLLSFIVTTDLSQSK